MSEKLKEYKELDKYFLIKSNSSKLIWKQYEDQIPYFMIGDSFARVVAEDTTKDMRLYLVLTPYRIQKGYDVFWKEFLVYDDALNAKKEFLPMNDVLRAMFETSETSNEINFSYFNNHYNIGLGTPVIKHEKESPLFYELPINTPSLKVNDNNKMPVKLLIDAIKSSGIHELDKFQEELLHNRILQKNNFEKEKFKQKALAFFLDKKRVNFNLMLPNKLMSLYQDKLSEAVEHLIHLRPFLKEETINKLDNIERNQRYKENVKRLVEGANLKQTKKSQKALEKDTTIPYKLKKEMLEAYREYGRKIAQSFLYNEDGLSEFFDGINIALDKWILSLDAISSLLEEYKNKSTKQQNIEKETVSESHSNMR